VQSFKDSAGNIWPVEITLGAIERAEAHGVPLGELIEDGAKYESAIKNAKSFAVIVWATCNPETKGVSEAAFKELMGGSAIRDAQEALVSAFLDFTLPRQVAAGLTASRAKALEATYPILLKRAEKELEAAAQALLNSPGPSPDSAG